MRLLQHHIWLGDTVRPVPSHSRKLRMIPTSIRTLTDTSRSHTIILMQSLAARQILSIVRAQEVFARAQASMAKEEPTRLKVCKAGRFAGSISLMCFPTPRSTPTVVAACSAAERILGHIDVSQPDQGTFLGEKLDGSTYKCQNHHPIIPPQPAASTASTIDPESKENGRDDKQRPDYGNSGLATVHDGKPMGQYLICN